MKSIRSNIKKAKNYLDNNECIAILQKQFMALQLMLIPLKRLKIYINLKKDLGITLIVHYTLKDLNADCVINEDFLKLYNKFSPGQSLIF